MTKTIKTISLSAVLAVGFLTAGAFAGANDQATSTLAAATKSNNVTVIYKNSTWPLSGQITTEACKANRCQEV